MIREFNSRKFVIYNGRLGRLDIYNLDYKPPQEIHPYIETIRKVSSQKLEDIFIELYIGVKDGIQDKYVVNFTCFCPGSMLHFSLVWSYYGVVKGDNLSYILEISGYAHKNVHTIFTKDSKNIITALKHLFILFLYRKRYG
jgi:hypothetical protein